MFSGPRPRHDKITGQGKKNKAGARRSSATARPGKTRPARKREKTGRLLPGWEFVQPFCAGPYMHTPATQALVGAWHTFPQVPQLSTSRCRSTHLS